MLFKDRSIEVRTISDRIPGVGIVLLVAMVMAVGGCRRDSTYATPSRDEDRAKRDTLRRTVPADPFDIGADRKPTPDTMYALAKILAARDRQTESMGILRNIITQYPGYLPAYNALAEAYIQTGQSEEAIKILSVGLERAPDDAVLLNNLGMTHFLREEYAEALPQFTRAADLRPEVPLYRANKAAALGMLGRSQEARMEYRQFLRPTDADENVDILNRARRHRRVPATPAAIERREAEGAAQPHAPIAAQP